MIYSYYGIPNKYSKQMLLVLFTLATAVALIVASWLLPNAADTAKPGALHRVSGGGHIVEDNGGDRSTWNDVSFGVNVTDFDGGSDGNLNIRLHNVSDDSLDKTNFHSTAITDFNYFDGDSATCESALNLTAMGSLNGVDGYTVIFRAGDNGSPNVEDTARVQLFDPADVEIYDTHDGDFTDESDCVGTARTGLDTGNLTIKSF